MKIFKSKLSVNETHEELNGIKAFVQEYLVPGIRAMLREELGKISDTDRRLANIEIEMPGLRKAVKSLVDGEQEKIGLELIKKIMDGDKR